MGKADKKRGLSQGTVMRPGDLRTMGRRWAISNRSTMGISGEGQAREGDVLLINL